MMLQTVVTGIFTENFILLAVIVGMAVFLLEDQLVAPLKKRQLVWIISMIFLVAVSDQVEQYYAGLEEYHIQRVIASVITYDLKPCLLMAACWFFSDNRKIHFWTGIGELVNIGVFCLAFCTDWVFGYDAENNFFRGPLGYTCHVFSGIFLVVLSLILYRKYREEKSNGKKVLAFTFLMLFAAAMLDTFGTTRYTVTAAALACLFYCMYAYLQEDRKYHEEQKRKLKEQRDALMLSQIQPHFIYNTLNTIYYLCKKDPELAGDSVRKFSKYLRNNLDMSSEADQLIPFTQEIQNTKVYTDLEMLRFENIHVEYVLQSENFRVPALCVQPLVENAIRHGVRGKECGIVRVASCERGGVFVVTVEDNGIGYVREQKSLGTHEHIGIPNVKERVERMCGGTFEIQMVRDQGTTITMTFPERI